MHFDYTTVGHVTIDVLEDGSTQPGGAAFYSALQAARLGLRTQIVTRGNEREIEQLLEPHRNELELRIQPARHTTTLQTSGQGESRSQRVLAWAGPIAEDLEFDTSILHLAPVTRETPWRWRGTVGFLGLTPQGLARTWDAPRGRVGGCTPSRAASLVAARCDAMVVSEHERICCNRLIERASDTGAIVAITAGDRPSTILMPDGCTLELAVPFVEAPLEDLGAGDVFAAAFFIALAEGQPVLEAVGLGNAAAAVRMSGHGGDAVGGTGAIDARVHAARYARRSSSC
ncbi:MAG: PfkB family carbohydrate kinase [Solirubrobacteraceae bacterium]